MKRKIKRKLFLMGMVVTAGFPGVGFAKGGGKAERDAYLHASQWHSVENSVPAEAINGGDAQPIGLYSRLKTIVGSMNYSVEVPVAQAKPRGWRLEMLQTAVPLDAIDDPKPVSEKRVGLALRVAF